MAGADHDSGEEIDWKVTARRRISRGEIIFGDEVVPRIGTLLIPNRRVAAVRREVGLRARGRPFKNKRGYGLYSFVKQRPGLPETVGEKTWREAQQRINAE